MDAFEFVRQLKAKRREILVNALDSQTLAFFELIEEFIRHADELLTRNGPHIDLPIPTPLAHVVQPAIKPARIPLFQRRQVLKEYLTATGPATRAQILKDTAIPAGTLSALLAERTDFEPVDNGLWAVREHTTLRTKKKVAGAT